MDQCHGAGVAVVDGVPDMPPRCDAVVTRSTDVALAVLVADCVPVLLSGSGGVVAAVHAGRPGLVAGVVPRALATMRDLGAGEVDAVVGPSVCGRCYEVPERDARRRGRGAAGERHGVVDRHAGRRRRCRGRRPAARRPVSTVRWVPGCSRESDDLYSYRRDGLDRSLRRASSPGAAS